MPYSGPKRPFFVPRGPHLTQNLKNIVLQVVLTQNIAFQGWNWSPNKNGNFGVCRPPPNPPGAPQTPPGVRGGQKWLWCTCPSPVLIISDKKMIFEGVNILTHFFPRTHPGGILKVGYLLPWNCVELLRRICLGEPQTKKTCELGIYFINIYLDFNQNIISESSLTLVSDKIFISKVKIAV